MKKITVLLLSASMASGFANIAYTQRIVNNSVCTLTHLSSFESADVTKHQASSVIKPHSSGGVYVEVSLKSKLGDTYKVECDGVSDAGDIELSVDVAKRVIDVVTHSSEVDGTAPSKIGGDITIYGK